MKIYLHSCRDQPQDLKVELDFIGRCAMSEKPIFRALHDGPEIFGKIVDLTFVMMLTFKLNRSSLANTG